MKQLITFFIAFFLLKICIAQTCNVSLFINPSPSTICVGYSVNLSAFGNSASYVWSPSVGLNNSTISSPIATPSITTTYQVIATCTNGGFDTAFVVVTVNQKPITTFSYSPLSIQCSSVPILFSTNASGGLPPYNYNWMFGSSSSNLANPSLSSNSVGCGSISSVAQLIITDVNGCKDTASQSITQNAIPFKPLLTDSNILFPFKNCGSVTGTPNYLLTLLNASTIASCVSVYTIDWGDGTGIQSFSNPLLTSKFRHIYTAYGIYTITVNAVSTNGCSSANSYIFKNFGSPAVGITGPSNAIGCLPKTFCYKLNNYQNNTIGTHYRWRFNDGTPDVKWNYNQPFITDSICHTFTTTSCKGPLSPGNFIVEVWAINDCDSVQATYNGTRIYTKPVAGIALGANQNYWGCTNMPFNLSFTIGLGLGSGCPIINFEWTIKKYNSNYKDTVYSQNPAYLFPTTGKYNVKFYSSNICGVDIDSFDICIDTTFTPIITCGNDTGCFPFTTTFNLNPVDTSICLARSYQWVVTYQNGSTNCPNSVIGHVYQGGTNSNSQNPIIKFVKPGTYIVYASVLSGCGYLASTAITIEALSKPIPFILTSGFADCGSITQTFNDTISKLCNQALVTQQLWEFGGGTPATSTLFQATATFNTAGVHKIKCILSNFCGAIYDSIFDTVLAQPIVNAGNDFSICKGIGDTIKASIISNGSNFTYNWNPKIWISGFSSSRPFAYPPYDTTYVLTATYGNNCIGSDTVTVHVNPTPILVVHNLKPAICEGDTAIIYATGGSNYTWTGNNLLNNNVDTIYAVPTSTSTYVATFTNSFNCTSTVSTIVQVNSKPIVQVSPSPINTICLGNNITMLASGANTYTWSPNVALSSVSGSSTIASPIVNSTYVLTGTNNLGCKDTVHFLININGNQTTAGYAIHDTICAGESTLLIALGSTSYSWSPPFSLNKSIGDSVLASPISTTTYLLTGAPQSGCPDTALVIVYVHPYSNFNVSHSNPIICKNQTVDTISISGGSNFVWQNPTTNLQFISATNVIASPTITTTFNVAGTNNLGCSIISAIAVYVDSVPSPSFNHNAVACVNAPVNFTNTTTSLIQFLWKFGDGDTSTLLSPIHIYKTAGKYKVKLIAKNAGGCIDSIFDSISIINLPQTNFSLQPKIGCGPLQVAYNNLNIITNTTYSWSLGNGTNYNGITPPNTTYPIPYKNDSIFVVQLIATNQCGTNISSDSVIVKTKPTASFGTNVSTGCSPLNVVIVNTTLGSSLNCSWNFGDGTFSNLNNPISHQYFTGNTDSIYLIQLATSNACGVDTFYKSISVKSNTLTSTINVNPSTGCAPFSTQFTSFTSRATSLYWNFGNGNFSTQTIATQTFLNAGTYQVYLYSNNGCSYDTQQVSVFVNPSLKLKFSSSDTIICSGNSVLFSNTTTGLSNIQWRFGDGLLGSLSNEVHTYNVSGNYLVAMIGTSSLYGCIDSIHKNIIVNPSPLISVTPSPLIICQFQNIQFNNSSSNTNYHNWNFDDGNFSNKFSPTHQFNNSRNFNVQYIASNIYNCVDTNYYLITVNPAPVAAFSNTISTACILPAVVSIFNSSIGANNYVWNDGLGNISLNTNPVFNYQQGGNFIIQLIASNNFNCSDTISTAINITQPLHAGFQTLPQKGCMPLDVLFLDTSAHANYHYWNFGDGSTSQNISVHHIYNDAGIYSVSLKIEDAQHQCIDSIVKQNWIEVLQTPTAIFTYEPLYTPIPEVGINFHNHSLNANNSIWNFGDGIEISTNDTLVKHNYSKYGIYNVMLIAIHTNGCADTIYGEVKTEYLQSLTMPNAMMPAAGASDEVKLFKPKGIGIKKYHIEIFSTWGEKIWESTALDEHGSPKEFWDGTYQGNDATKKGMLMPQDVYVWKAEAVFADENIWKGNTYDGVKFSNTGTITLLR